MLRKLKKNLFITVISLLASLNCLAQGATPNGQTLDDFMRSNNKIYVVMTVCIVILVVLILYLIRIDIKISHKEKEK